MRCIPDRICEFRKRRRFLGFFDELHRPCHRLPVAADLVRLAAKARAIAGGTSFFTAREEFDMLAFGTARRTARLAVDAGCLHRAENTSVPAAVAPHEGRPGGVRIE